MFCLRTCQAMKPVRGMSGGQPAVVEVSHRDTSITATGRSDLRGLSVLCLERPNWPKLA